MESVYCDNCNQLVSFRVVKRELVGNLKGKEYKYIGEVAICEVCGEEVWVPQIHDDNLTALYAAYRAENNIISAEDLEKIPAMYNIGKRPLSELLGWGSLTFTRYLEGYIPTPEYSDTLKQILNEPSYYLSVLEKNKDKITDVAYRKSKLEVEALLADIYSSRSKLENVADYLLNASGGLTPLALQKSLYYAKGWMLAFYGKLLFTDSCVAWQHGPVYSRIFRKYAYYRYEIIEETEYIPEQAFTKEEKAVLDAVAEHFSCFNGKVLEEFTHKEEPWLEARRFHAPLESSNIEIDVEVMERFFKGLKNKYNMKEPDDIKEYVAVMWDSFRNSTK